MPPARNLEAARGISSSLMDGAAFAKAKLCVSKLGSLLTGGFSPPGSYRPGCNSGGFIDWLYFCSAQSPEGSPLTTWRLVILFPTLASNLFACLTINTDDSEERGKTEDRTDFQEGQGDNHKGCGVGGSKNEGERKVRQSQWKIGSIHSAIPQIYVHIPYIYPQ